MTNFISDRPWFISNALYLVFVLELVVLISTILGIHCRSIAPSIEEQVNIMSCDIALIVVGNKCVELVAVFAIRSTEF